ncbi:hypothetical protein [Corynebacterium sp. A21]|uniref:hypothetical protein n=1 Tax=Corynebacterium sp. A21 TaxID=3457318 RepID=UPI003FD40656
MQEDAPENTNTAPPETTEEGILRLRLPGGRVAPGRWTRIAELAELGDGRIQLSRRGNLHIRGVVDAEQFVSVATAAGFRPGCSLIASPLARLDALVQQVEQVVAARDARLLVGIDDGSGDILAQRPHLGLQLDESREQARLIQAGHLATELLPLDQAVAMLHELEASPDTPEPGSTQDARDSRAIGWLPAADGTITLGAGITGGLLDAQLARMLDVIEVPTTVTPWQGLLIHDLSESIADQVLRVLAPLGLIFDENSSRL